MRTVWHGRHLPVLGVMLALLMTAALSPRAAEDREMPRAEVGRPAPDITFTTLDGRTLRLADFRGRPVMLWLITTWCPSCTASAQELNRRIDELADTDLVIVVLKLYENLGYEGPPLARFVADNAPRLRDHPRVIWGEADFDASVAYDPQAVTDLYWLIDRDGVIRGSERAPAATFATILDFAGAR